MPPLASASRFAYVAGTTGISAYSVNLDKGKLTEIAGSPFARETHPSSVKVGPSDRVVYSTELEYYGVQGVHAYSIDRTTGALSEIVGSPSAEGRGALIIHPSGKFVYAVDNASGVWAYRVAADGALVQVEGSPFAPGGSSHDIAIDPSGQYAFVDSFLNNRLYTFRIDPTSGALTKIAETMAGDHPAGVAVAPSGKFAFVASGGSGDLGGHGGGGAVSQNSGVWAFSIDPATGTLTEIGSVAIGGTPFRITVHPTGKFVYVTNLMSGNISAFSIDALGALTSIGTPFPTVDRPWSITMDPSGRFVYVTSFESSTISGYSIDANTGILAEMDGSPLSTPILPASITFTAML